MRRVTPAGLARGGAVTAAGLAFPLLVTAPYLMTIAIFTVMYAALATSWNLLGGFSGYLSLGHAAFFGVGAYAEAIVFTHIGIGGGYRPFAVVPLIGLGVAVAAIPIAIVFLRVRGATFAIVTISLLFIVQLLAFNLRSLTNGAQGMSMAIPPFPVATYERPFYYGMLAVFLGSVLTCWIVSTGKLGLMLFAIRDDEDRAHGLGVRVTAAKVIAFCVSAGLFAMPGAIWAYYEGFIYPQFAVDPLVTIGAVLMAFLGGRGTIWGPMLGALILVPAQQYLAYSQGASQLYLIGYSAVFLVIMLLMPRGIIPSVRPGREPQPVRPAGRRRRVEATHERSGDVTALLEGEGLTKRFGGIAALDSCSISVAEGTITALIGPNGSGKTTLFNLVTGYLPADSGSIAFAGRSVRRPHPASLYRMGLCRTFQQARVFSNLTVIENMAAAILQPWSSLLRSRVRPSDRSRALEVLDDFGLTRLADAPAGTLSFGQRKLLEFATVLMGRPRIILLDEPTSGVNPVMIEIMERHIRELNAQGLTFLLVEHDMHVVMRLCDPVVVLDHGAKIAEGAPAAVQSDPTVLDAYLGT